MATKDKINIHEVKDKPKIVVGPNSKAKRLVNPKYINQLPQDERVGSFREAEERDLGEEAPEDTGLAAPEYSDIFLKYNGSYENVTLSHNYGSLYNISPTASRVKLEFKVMIPIELADEVIGIEILSGDEVIASI